MMYDNNKRMLFSNVIQIYNNYANYTNIHITHRDCR